MADVLNRVERVRRFRTAAVFGGLFFGALVGVAATGPNLAEWPFARALGTIVGAGILGALVGFLFVEIALRSSGGDDLSPSLLSGGSTSTSQSCSVPNDSGSESGDN